MSWDDDDERKELIGTITATLERLAKQQQAAVSNTRHGLTFDVPGDELAAQLSARASEVTGVDNAAAKLLKAMARFVNPNAVYILSAYDLQLVIGVLREDLYPKPGLGVLPKRDL